MQLCGVPRSDPGEPVALPGWKAGPAWVRRGKAENRHCILTATQIQTANQEYPDYHANGKFAIPSFELGSEAQWPCYLLGLPFPLPLGDGYMQFFPFNDPTWNYRTLQYNNSIMWIADAQDPSSSTADNYNLAVYKNGGVTALQS